MNELAFGVQESGHVEKTYVTVPNKQMVDSVVDNLSLRSQRRVELRLELDLKTNAAQINGLLEGIHKILGASKILQQSVLLTDISADAYLVICEYYTETIAINEFNELKQSVNLKVIDLMEELGIEIAGAGKDIRVRK